jgi:SAM-dependent methyltransferase
LQNIKASKKAILELLTISLVSLFFELAVIRWLSSEIRIFAYFKNVPLMACLFGLGLGCALSGRKDFSRWFPLSLLVLTVIISCAEPLHLVHVAFLNPLENYLIGHFSSTSALETPLARLMFFLPGLAVLVSVFYLIVFVFSCLGQRIGRLFNEMQPLSAYSVNVFASLVGVLLFTWISFLLLPPPAWLLIGVALSVPYFRKPDQLVTFVIALTVAFITANPEVRWSPYYRISVEKCMLAGDATHPHFDYGYNINVNYDSIEGAYNNRPEALAGLSEKQKKSTADFYDTPYLVLKDKPRDILVLAAGTGNDVAAALRHGAVSVDAVEIDPTIVQLGRELHPERPYEHGNVRVIVDDARAFLRRTNKKYDLVVFAYLDSHTAFSSMSSLRLDNYVYTTECFRDSLRVLKPQGTISCTFFYLTWWQLARVYRCLAEASGQVPAGAYSPKGNGPTLFVGPGLDRNLVQSSGLKIFSVGNAAYEMHFPPSEWDSVSPASDDWPFLFLRNKSLTWTYSLGLLFTLSAGWLVIGKFFGGMSFDSIDRAMFFLGAAFMLIETKTVTQMGLLLGTTWLVNSVVVGCILLLILAANLVQMRWRFANLKVLYGLLFAMLVVDYFVPLSVVADLPQMSRVGLGVFLLSAPLFFAAMIFAITFARVKDSSKALGMNLLGSLVGGILEYLSMLTGINALNLLSLALYGLAFICSVRSSPPAAPQLQSDPD